jgi:hypothetical protein
MVLTRRAARKATAKDFTQRAQRKGGEKSEQAEAFTAETQRKQRKPEAFGAGVESAGTEQGRL